MKLALWQKYEVQACRDPVPALPQEEEHHVIGLQEVVEEGNAVERPPGERSVRLALICDAME